MSHNVINIIVNNDLCCGCGVCSGICPHNTLVMTFNIYGEYIPFQEKECPEICGICLIACPFYERNSNEDDLGKSLYEGISDIKYLSETGYYLDSYVGHSIIRDLRQTGASGGMTRWLLETLITNRIVDYVICVTPQNDPDKLFHFEIFNDTSFVSKSSGSVYYPVEMSQVIQRILEKPGRYVITGLPCFLKSLRLASKKNVKLRERIFVTIGLVCGQMKSKHYTTYLSTLANSCGKLQKVYYRGKSPDKPANNFYFQCVNENGTEGKIFWNEGVSDAWTNRWFTLNACNYCDDVFAELADVTFMDAWLPEYSDDSQGNNLIIVRSPTVRDIILKGMKNMVINVQRISICKVIQSQSGVIQFKRKQLPYRLQLAIKKGFKVPYKRDGKIKGIGYLERQDINLKNNMQNASKNIFIENFQENFLEIKNFRNEMQPYLNRLKHYNHIRKLSILHLRAIKKAANIWRNI